MKGSLICGAAAFVFWSLTAASASAQGRHALLIGNQSYDPDKVGELKNPFNDIEIVGKALERLDFRITRIADGKFREMHAGIQAHAERVRADGPNAISFVYYSGHGAADPETKINYLIPVDVPAADETLWQNSVELKANVVDRLVAHAPNAMHFVVVDACRNELQLRLRGVKSFNVAGKALVSVQNTLKSLVVFSTAADRTASDLGEGSGPYARALSEEIVKPGVESVTMFRNVALRVKQSSGQYPFISELPPFSEVYFAGTGPRVDPAIQAERVAFDQERASVRKNMQLLLSQIGSEIVEGFGEGIIDPAKKWPKAGPEKSVSLRICFLDGNTANHSHVARIGKQWSLYGDVDFDFGSWTEPRRCDLDETADIRISFRQSGFWSYVGTDARIARASDPTMNFQGLGTGQLKALELGEYDTTILHEFGHVLGFVHGWSAADSGCDSEFNWEYIYQELLRISGWTKQNVDDNMRNRQLRGSKFDRKSIMNYAMPPSFYRRGVQSSCYVDKMTDLSLRDKLTVFYHYK